VDHVLAALITGPGTLELLDFATPAPTGTRVAVSITLCGICGTDLSAFRTGALHTPAVCGHEWVGTVSALGEGVTSLAEGTRVVIAVPPPCSACPECVAGLPEFCRHVVAVSRGRDAAAPAHGGFASRLVVDETRVVPALDVLSDVEAAQVEPATVAFHGVRRARIAPGDVVVVQGGGPIGLLAVQCAHAVGAGTVVVVEPTAARRALALELGADAAVAPGTEAEQLVHELTTGRGADVVLECAGRPELVMSAVDLVRRGGMVLLLGYTTEEASFRPGVWLSKEVTIRGAVGFTRDDVHRTMRLMAQGRVRTAPLHTRTVGLEALPGVLRELVGGSECDLKVLVDPQR
jgi:(R,R)-butanediol dehydrogenase/meso-butanediol dehydrogenase/diacetyl reductase